MVSLNKKNVCICLAFDNGDELDGLDELDKLEPLPQTDIVSIFSLLFIFSNRARDLPQVRLGFYQEQLRAVMLCLLVILQLQLILDNHQYCRLDTYFFISKRNI